MYVLLKLNLYILYVLTFIMTYEFFYEVTGGREADSTRLLFYERTPHGEIKHFASTSVPIIRGDTRRLDDLIKEAFLKSLRGAPTNGRPRDFSFLLRRLTVSPPGFEGDYSHSPVDERRGV